MMQLSWPRLGTWLRCCAAAKMGDTVRLEPLYGYTPELYGAAATSVLGESGRTLLHFEFEDSRP
jgi:hypothetical protein